MSQQYCKVIIYTYIILQTYSYTNSNYKQNQLTREYIFNNLCGLK